MAFKLMRIPPHFYNSPPISMVFDELRRMIGDDREYKGVLPFCREVGWREVHIELPEHRKILYSGEFADDFMAFDVRVEGGEPVLTNKWHKAKSAAKLS